MDHLGAVTSVDRYIGVSVLPYLEVCGPAGPLELLYRLLGWKRLPVSTSAGSRLC